MKSSIKIMAIMLVLAVAGSMDLSAQRGMRGMRPDSTMLNRMEFMQQRMQMHQDMGRMPGMGMPPYAMRNQRQDFNRPGRGRRGPAEGFRQPGMGMRQQGMPGIYNIPNLTDKQKKDIADLKGKQQAEMEKLRIDKQSKMKELRESHRTKVMSLLTDEQKKWLEENKPAPEGLK